MQVLVALTVMAPALVAQTGLDRESLPRLARVPAAAGALARMSALPEVETFLRRYVRWLAADPPPRPQHHEDG